MGREVRRVPADWQHPKYPDNDPHVYRRGRYIPMHESSYEDALAEYYRKTVPNWYIGFALWQWGWVDRTYSEERFMSVDVLLAEHRAKAPSYRPVPEDADYYWWAGPLEDAPSPDDYMPQWSDEQRTHYMMYEDTSEGTPISPAFTTPEELARWLADTGASAFADHTASYDAWLRVARGGWAPSAVLQDGEMKSGVEALAE